MKISELIKKLEQDLESFGDLDVVVDSEYQTNWVIQETQPVDEYGKYDDKNPVALEIY